MMFDQRRHRAQPQIELLEARMLLSAGDLDPTFGSGGNITTIFQGSLNIPSQVVDLLPDGKILSVGGTASAVVLTRHSTNGGLDTAFGNGGMVITALSSVGSGY